ncbi:CLUMA_CG000961, isoform A [Clunio marinus]|uniref:CLUMA_CG000961, isoform A n=1 Tax=Clunio marinus TaxID=568069 RepID=A0A1J1HGK6_9DIPT|nr:CLUMA_CG000961, isoform A [Clunio marinus]
MTLNLNDAESVLSSCEDLKISENPICCFRVNSRNPAIKRDRQFQLFKMIILPFIPILALLIQTSFSLYDIIQYRNEVNEIESQVVMATDLGKVVTRLQLERGEVAFYIYTNGSILKSNLTQRYATTDEAINNMTTWTQIILPASSNTNDEVGEVMLNKTSFQMRLNDFRTQIHSEENNNTVFEAMLWYMAVNNAMLGHLTNQIKESDKSGIWRYLIGFKNLIRSIENIGVAAVYGINYYGRGHLSTDAYVNYIKYDALGRDLLNSSFTYVASLRRDYRNLTNFPEYGSIKNRSRTISLNRKINPSIEDAIKYYGTMTFYVERLRNMHSNLRRRIKQEVRSLLKEASDKEAIGIAILVTVLIVSPIIIIFLRNAVATIQVYSMNLVQKARELKLEQKKSDALLFQMLPTSVAIRLKQTRRVPAEFFESATIYFSDIVGFTEIASTCSPLEVCSFLNSIYKLFDERIECYDVYKVETCGDAYMVASGLPERSHSKKHVSEIATMALDLLHASSYFKIPHSPNEKLQIRIGIHTGSVGAGDTVNVASRMESTGEASKIHITSEVNDELQLIGGFKTEARGLIDVKNKIRIALFLHQRELNILLSFIYPCS